MEVYKYLLSRIKGFSQKSGIKVEILIASILKLKTFFQW